MLLWEMNTLGTCILDAICFLHSFVWSWSYLEYSVQFWPWCPVCPILCFLSPLLGLLLWLAGAADDVDKGDVTRSCCHWLPPFLHVLACANKNLPFRPSNSSFFSILLLWAWGRSWSWRVASLWFLATYNNIVPSSATPSDETALVQSGLLSGDTSLCS